MITRSPRIHPALALLAVTVLLTGCSRNDAADDAVNPRVGSSVARLVSAAEILAGANIPTLDPHTMADAQIKEIIGAGPRCAFHYTSSGDPVLGTAREPAQDVPAGVVMLNGNLVALQSAPAEAGLVLVADEIRFTITSGNGDSTTPSPSSMEDATLVMHIGDQLTVGYRGYYGCAEE
ncbi:hypothetical protein GGR20_003743 [Devosia subaequoris]|uniref:Uncharacterized protein n=1 Tax=Devosia subaequoris TaxID=395930 RepID=A0A7W6IRS2_9HYPH|nr:hypothetical protein [Devosia subaequoris]MBB4054067.1 hypothetical protein [Devosia subaequoris]MCP1211584.1 hypothetical protein [Devosia subaequoris]